MALSGRGQNPTRGDRFHVSGWGILARGGLGGRPTREFPFDRRWEGHFS